jgi:hypothetical protein
MTLNLKERIAELKHEQWIFWSKKLAESENISKERLERWEKLWVPYDRLTEDEKDFDRELAEEVIEVVVDWARLE